jgi:uncharacterized protein
VSPTERKPLTAIAAAAAAASAKAGVNAAIDAGIDAGATHGAAPMLCVSIHDVAPATWPDCLRLVQAVREVADIPLTWLVVPHYHFRPERSPAMEACLDVVLERGDELALHGYSHLDTEANGGGLARRFLRNVYTRKEGEFAALTEAEAQRRLQLGLAWFAERGWTPNGFVPPAWLLGKGAWNALRASDFAYTTTFSHFHCLRDGAGQASRHSVLSPSLVYAARNRGGRLLSPRVADATARMLEKSPLVRFSLHPPDARYPELVRHAQRVLERLLAQREAVTKDECARRLVRGLGAYADGVDAGRVAPSLVIVQDIVAPAHAAAVDGGLEEAGKVDDAVSVPDAEADAHDAQVRVGDEEPDAVADAMQDGAVQMEATQPEPVQAAATQARAAQVEATQAEAARNETAPTEVAPAEVVPAEVAPAEAAPVDAAHAEAAPANAAHANAAHADAAPAAATPPVPASADTVSADKPGKRIAAADARHSPIRHASPRGDDYVSARYDERERADATDSMAMQHAGPSPGSGSHATPNPPERIDFGNRQSIVPTFVASTDPTSRRASGPSRSRRSSADRKDRDRSVPRPPSR